MDATTIRRQLHQLIDDMEDKKLKAIYTILENDIEEDREEIAHSDEFKAEIDRRYEAYKKDGKVISREALNKRIKKIIAGAK